MHSVACIGEDLLIVTGFDGKGRLFGLVFMYQDLICYYYVSVLHLYGYSVNGHFSIRVRVRVWYYMK